MHCSIFWQETEKTEDKGQSNENIKISASISAKPRDHLDNFP